MPTTPETILQGAYALTRPALVAELRAQGHHLTGALESSLTPQVKGETLDVVAFAYLQKLEQGVAAGQIQINSAALAEMTRYVELRMGYQGRKAAQVALLILQKQAEEGNPTKGSYDFSQTGERTGAIEATFRKLGPQLDTYMDDGIDQMVEDAFSNEDLNTEF